MSFLKYSLLPLAVSGLMVLPGYAKSNSQNHSGNTTQVQQHTAAGNANNEYGQSCTYAYSQAYGSCHDNGGSISLAEVNAGGVASR
jgi:hypothetical protein